jgi:hypothetical protein
VGFGVLESFQPDHNLNLFHAFRHSTPDFSPKTLTTLFNPRRLPSFPKPPHQNATDLRSAPPRSNNNNNNFSFHATAGTCLPGTS